MPVINSGGQTHSVTSGQIDSGDVIGGGSMFGLSGGEAETTVAGGGSLTISAGGTDSGTQRAGTEVMGGLDIAATISSAATVASGGTAGSAIVPSDGTLIVNAAGVAANAAVIAGGPEIVGAGGEQDGTANAPSQILAAGSAASGAMISGGELKVASGGLADPASIASAAVKPSTPAASARRSLRARTTCSASPAGPSLSPAPSRSRPVRRQLSRVALPAAQRSKAAGLVFASSGGIASTMRINSGDVESGGGNWTSRQADQEK